MNSNLNHLSLAPIAFDETFRTVSGFSDYEVSNYGRVISHKRGKPRLLRPHVVRGYVYYGLSLKGRLRGVAAHRLVAMAFLDGISEGLQVDHIDGNRSNNHVSNLRFATRQENARNRSATTGSHSRFLGVAKDRWRPGRWKASIEVNMDDERRHLNLGHYRTEEEAAKVYNVAAVLIFESFANPNSVEVTLDDFARFRWRVCRYKHIVALCEHFPKVAEFIGWKGGA